VVRELTSSCISRNPQVFETAAVPAFIEKVLFGKFRPPVVPVPYVLGLDRKRLFS
jgi:hypothetical protein